MDHQNPESIESIYRRYITMVRRQARRILGDAAGAEDVAQEVFLRFFTHRAQGATQIHLSAFLFRMTTNIALNVLRKNRRQTVTSVFDESVRSENSSTLVRESLAFCDAVTARVAACHFMANQSQEEIATELGLSRHVVRQHLDAFVQATRKGWEET